jgi:WD40 repeat protein
VFAEEPSPLASALLDQAPVEAARLLAAVLPCLAPPLEQAVLAALRRSLGQAAPAAQERCDAAWAAWAETRHPGLGELLVELGIPAAGPLALRLLSLLCLGRLAELAGSGPEAIPALLEAAGDADPGIAAAAGQVLCSLADPAAQDELCRWVVSRDQPAARRLALQAGYAPSDPLSRALFFLLTEQWERYEALDIDASLAATVYETASPELRLRLAHRASQAGWGGFVQAVSGGRAARRLGQLSAVEWEVVLTLLERERRFSDAWELVQVAPLQWGARLLVVLQAAGWEPPLPEDRPAFQDLAQQASACLVQGIPPGTAAHTPLVLSGHTRAVNALAFVPPAARAVQTLADGQDAEAVSLLASGGGDGLVCLWRLEKPDVQPIRSQPSAASRSGERLSRLSRTGHPASSPGVLNGEALPSPWLSLQAHSGYTASLAASPDGAFLASGGADRAVRLWPVPRTWQESRTRPAAPAAAQVLGGHAGEVSLLAFSPDNAWLASGDAAIGRLWQLPGARLTARLQPGEGRLQALAFSPDGRWLAAGDDGRSVGWIPVPAHAGIGAELQALMENSQAWTFTADGSRLASASSYGQVRLWSFPQGELLATLTGRADGRLLVSCPASAWLAASDRNALHLWHLPDLYSPSAGEPPVRFPLEPIRLEPVGAGLRPAPPLTGLTFSPSGSLLAAGGEDGSLLLWDMEPAGLAGRGGSVGAGFRPTPYYLPGVSSPLRLLAFDPGSSWLAAADKHRLLAWRLEYLSHAWITPARLLDLAAERRLQALLDDPDLQEEPGLLPAQRLWLELCLKLARFRRRYEIAIDLPPHHLSIGEMDIQY